jgi:hypothetical protein
MNLKLSFAAFASLHAAYFSFAPFAVKTLKCSPLICPNLKLSFAVFASLRAAYFSFAPFAVKNVKSVRHEFALI